MRLHTKGLRVAFRATGAAGNATAGLGATRQSEGLLRVRGRARLRAPGPAPSGRSGPAILPGRVSSAASMRRRTRSPNWLATVLSGIAGEDRDAPVPPRCLPSRPGLMDRERPQARLGWPCTSQPSPCRTRHPKGGVAPATTALSRTAPPFVRPWCNRNAGSDMRSPRPCTWTRRFRARAPRCRCARAVCHRPRPIGGQDRSPRIRLERHTDSRGSFLRTGPNRSRALIPTRR